MSVISECLENDQIVIISDFVACKDSEEFEWENSREFNIGEEVYYIDGFKNEKSTQEHLQWFVKFKTKEGDIYSATQLYFVSREEWEDIINCIKN